MRKEVVESKNEAKKRYGLSLMTFAYPMGGFTQEVIGFVREAGYRCAFTTNRGFYWELNLYKIRRIKISNWDQGLRFWVKLSGFYNAFRRLR